MLVTVRTVVMVFGAIVAVGGLVLLFVRQEHGRNKIKVAGQEFEISTPALVVFLCGCLIFVLPLLRPSDVLDQPAFVLGAAAGGSGAGASSRAGVKIDAEEKEPNDQLTMANAIPFGARISGSVADEKDRDYFMVRTPDAPGDARVIVRKLRSGGFWATLTVLDGRENRVASTSANGDDPVSLGFEAKPATDYYLLVRPFGSDRGPYELEVRKD